MQNFPSCHTCRVAVKPLCHRTYALMRAVGWEEDTLDDEEADGAQTATIGHQLNAEKTGDVEMTGTTQEVDNPMHSGKADEAGGLEDTHVDDSPVRDRTHTIDRNVSRRSSASGRLSGGEDLKDKPSGPVKSKRHSTSDLSDMI